MSKPAPLQIVSDLKTIPTFESESDEANFWATHRLSDDLLRKMGPFPEGFLPKARPRTRLISIRFDEDTLVSIKRIASGRRVPYQRLLKQFVQDRLDQELSSQSRLIGAEAEVQEQSDSDEHVAVVLMEAAVVETTRATRHLEHRKRGQEAELNDQDMEARFRAWRLPEIFAGEAA